MVEGGPDFRNPDKALAQTFDTGRFSLLFPVGEDNAPGDAPGTRARSIDHWYIHGPASVLTICGGAENTACHDGY